RIECAVQHGRSTPEGHELSEVISDDETERLIKVTGGDLAWQQERNWISSTLAVWRQGVETDDQARLNWVTANVTGGN
ncbi:MAG: hypothetical protein AB7U41_07465, partial [Dongiaceae bacterium]